MFPGGSGSEEYKAIGSAGAAAVTAFVNNGGGYLGTCAGSYLAMTGTCCDEVIPGYCNGKSGCAKSPYMLGLVDAYGAEPWDRGHGYVTIQLTPAAVKTLQLDPGKWLNKNMSILYWQGPVQDRKYSGKFDVLASFTSEIHSLHTPITTGQQINTPAIITSTYGQGRILLSSPHP